MSASDTLESKDRQILNLGIALTVSVVLNIFALSTFFVLFMSFLGKMSDNVDTLMNEHKCRTLCKVGMDTPMAT